MTDQENWTNAENATAGDDEWQEVEAEFMIKLETKGDGFIGRYLGMDPRNASGIVQGHWTNVDALNHTPLADAAFMNVTRDLERKLAKIPVKSLTRIEWVDSMDTGHESGTPMRVFDVKWKR